MDVGFKRIKWFQSKSAYQDMQHHRQRRAAAIKRHLEMMDAVNMALSNTQYNKINGLSTLSAQAALKRIQGMAMAKSKQMTTEIDNAQKVLDTAQANEPAPTPSSTLDTVV